MNLFRFGLAYAVFTHNRSLDRVKDTNIVATGNQVTNKVVAVVSR